MTRTQPDQQAEENEEVSRAFERIREHALVCSANLWGLPGSVLDGDEPPFRVEFLMLAMTYFFVTLNAKDVEKAFFSPGGMADWKYKPTRTTRKPNPEAVFAPYWITPPGFVVPEPVAK